jgi:hypothetical protein
MATKLFIQTSLLESPYLLSIPKDINNASETIFDFLLAYVDYQSRVVILSGDSRSTLWKCCSQEVQTIIQALYLKRMGEVFINETRRFQQRLDDEELADPELDQRSRDPFLDHQPRPVGRKILTTAADGDAELAKRQ